MENNANNCDLLNKGFDLLLEALDPYVMRELTQAYGNDFWQVGVLNKLYDDQKRNLPASGDYATLADSLDIALCLLLIDINWRDVFRLRLQELRHGAQGRSQQGCASRYGRYLGQRRMACARYHESFG